MRQSSPHKKSKLESQILQELGLCAKRTINDPRLQLISFTKAQLNKDNSRVKVYWDHYDSHKRGDTKQALETARSVFRNHLAQILTTRVAPSIEFIYDSQFEDELKIDELLKS